MMWLNNSSKKDILIFLYDNMGEYEGSFVRNMLKLSNIINNIINISLLINNINLNNKLKDASSLILKDIVNVNSLYLQ